MGVEFTRERWVREHEPIGVMTLSNEHGSPWDEITKLGALTFKFLNLFGVCAHNKRLFDHRI